MKFSVKFINKNGCRLGSLSGIKSNPDKIYETPLSLTVTKTGSVPHLTKDVFNDNFGKESLLCIPVQHFASHFDVLEAYKKGISNFVSLQTHPVCVVLQDPTTESPGGYNNSNSVSTFGAAGRIQLTPQKYMDLITVMQPDWYEPLNDSDTNASSSKKRVEKSMKNSFIFFEKCLQLHKLKLELKGVGLFAPLIGGHNALDRKKWSERILEKDVDGYCVSGLHENGTSAQSIDIVSLRECVLASLEIIKPNKVRQAQGAYSVLSILELVECGIDVFDSSLAFNVTENGRAFCFPNTLESIHDGSLINSSSVVNSCSKSENDIESSVGQIYHSNKKMKLDTSQDTLHSESDKIQRKEETICSRFEIDLSDKRYMNLKEPILVNCKCYTCTTFTKSYLHHLLSSKEMLATVLLMIHNLHHWEEFFKTIRESIRTEKFDQFKTVVKNWELKNSDL